MVCPGGINTIIITLLLRKDPSPPDKGFCLFWMSDRNNLGSLIKSKKTNSFIEMSINIEFSHFNGGVLCNFHAIRLITFK